VVVLLVVVLPLLLVVVLLLVVLPLLVVVLPLLLVVAVLHLTPVTSRASCGDACHVRAACCVSMACNRCSMFPQRRLLVPVQNRDDGFVLHLHQRVQQREPAAKNATRSPAATRGVL
jgi:hypothetical protein